MKISVGNSALRTPIFVQTVKMFEPYICFINNFRSNYVVIRPNTVVVR